ncbi:hypothetical protein PMIN02_002383 [Paraphaeosphaeria minitans]
MSIISLLVSIQRFVHPQPHHIPRSSRTLSTLLPRLTPLERLRNLPRLSPPRPHIPDLLPTNRHQYLSALPPRNHNTQFVLRSAQIIPALVPQTNHHGADQVADSKAILHGDFILLRRADVLAPDLRGEGRAAHARVGGDRSCVGGRNDEDLGGGEAGAQAGDAREDLRVDLGEDVR